MLHDLLSDQLGLITRDQARLLGVTDHQIDGHLAAGRWIRVHSGVHRLAGAPVSVDQLRLGAVLACGPGAALSHRTAAQIHGTRTFRADLLEVSLPGDGRPRLRHAVVHRMGDLRPDDIQLLGGLPVTSLERTVIDLGMVVREPTVHRIVEEWLADRRISVASLRFAIDRHRGRGRRGVGVARRVLEQRSLGDERGDSTDEHLLATVLRTYGSPPPTYHHLVQRHGRVLAELDFAYVAERIGLEVIGYHPHTRTRRDFESFLARQNLLQGEGWLLLGYTPAMIQRRPWFVAREIEDHRLARAVPS